MVIVNPKIQAVLVRAAKTFIQAALAVVVASGTNFVSVDVWKGAAIAGGAALLSFLWNLVGGVPEA